MQTEPKPMPTLAELSDKIDRLEAITLIGAKNVLDLDEATLFTGYSKGHLYRLTSGRQIPHFKKDRKLFFRKDELEAWLTAGDNRVRTEAELGTAAATYCSTHKAQRV